MRFIRDIIKEKRTSDGGNARRAPEAFEPVEPLVVDRSDLAERDAPAPDAAVAVQDTDVAAEGLTADTDVTSDVTPDTPETAAWGGDEETTGAASADALTMTEADPVPEIEAFDETDMGREAIDAPDEDADVPMDEDPFAKLRASDQFDAPVRKSVSPMRRMAETAPAEAPKAAPTDDPAPQAAEQTAPAPLQQDSPAAPQRVTPETVQPVTPAARDAAAVPDTTVAELDALKPAVDVTAEPVAMPAPAKGRGSARSGRVKTRLLGFSAGGIEGVDPFEKKPSTPAEFPVGWLVVVSDMGRGASFPLFDGVSKVGRGVDQTVSLNFGDNSISRDNHVAVAYDAEQNKFFIGHSGKTNLVRVNNVPLLSTEELKSKDLIRLGETTLRFMAFCADDFSWAASDEKVAKHA